MLLVILYTTYTFAVLPQFCMDQWHLRAIFIWYVLLKIKIENVSSSNLLYFHLTGVSLSELVTGGNKTSFQNKYQNFGDISK